MYKIRHRPTSFWLSSVILVEQSFCGNNFCAWGECLHVCENYLFVHAFCSASGSGFANELGPDARLDVVFLELSCLDFNDVWDAFKFDLVKVRRIEWRRSLRMARASFLNGWVACLVLWVGGDWVEIAFHGWILGSRRLLISFSFLFHFFLQFWRNNRVVLILLRAKRKEDDDECQLSNKICSVAAKPPSYCCFSNQYFIFVTSQIVRRRRMIIWVAVEVVVSRCINDKLNVPCTDRTDLEEKCDCVDNKHANVHMFGHSSFPKYQSDLYDAINQKDCFG